MTIKKRTLAEIEKEYGKTKPASEVFKNRKPFTFGRFIKMVRMDLELSQVEMAKKLKMAPGTLCDIEKGRQVVSVKLALKIAKMGGFPEEYSVRLAIQGQLDRANIKLTVQLHSA